jgi:energy-coupling factor transport system permease protein
MAGNSPFGYVPAASPLHRLDPRTKLAGSIGVTVSVLASASPVSCAFASVGLLVAVVVSGMGALALLRAYRSFLPVGILLFATVALTTPGTALPGIPLVSLSREGLEAGLLQLYRLYAFATVWAVFAYSTSPVALTDGIEAFFRPLARLGLPVRETGIVLMIAFRFVPVLFEETDRIIAAQKARGCDIGSGSPFKRIRNLVPIFVPLFVKALRRAEELSQALEARGFMDGRARTRLRPLSFGRNDLIAVLAIAAFCLASALSDRLY